MISETVLVTDFGVVSVDSETAQNLARIPMRKNGRSEDYRYRIAREYAAWFRGAQSAVSDAYLRGENIAAVRLVPFRPAA